MASSEGIAGVYDAAPSLVSSPGLALAAANDPNPQSTAETIAGTAQLTGVSQAVQQFQQSQGPGMYSGLTQKAGAPGLLHDAAAAGRILNMPLQQVQHTYRYIRDVYHRHGLFAGIMETLGVAAGAVAGGFAGTFIGAPELGAVLGGELAGRLEGFTYGDSWKKTSDPHYMLNGHLVSPGRDLASLLGFHPNKTGGFSGWGSFVSGLTDAGVDWYADPLMVAGKLRQVTKSEVGLRSVIAAKFGLKDEAAIQDSGNRIAAFMYRLAPGTGLDARYPDAIAMAYHKGKDATGALNGYSGVTRAIDWLAKQTPDHMAEVHPDQVENAKQIIQSRLTNINNQLGEFDPDVPDWQQQVSLSQLNEVKQKLESMSPKTVVATARIIGQFPELAPMAESIAKASSADEVMGIMRGNLFNAEMIGRMTRGALPSRSLMRAGIAKIGDKIADQDLQRKDETGALFGLDPTKGQTRFGAVGLKAGALTGQGFSAYASRKLRTFTGYAPFTPDRNTLDLAFEFDPKDPNAAQGILRSMKFGMGARSGEVWSALMLHAAQTGDTAMAKKIWAEGMVENLKAMGLPDDPELVDYITRKSRFLAQGSFPSEQYTVGYYGGDLTSMVKTQSGSQHLALYNYQRGLLAYPDFMRAKRAMRDMSFYTKAFGKLDDFAAEHYTNTFFKPLALVTMGFGTRIALNEALLGTAKFGNPAYVKAFVNSRLAKYGYKQASLLDGFKDANLDEQVQMMHAAVHAVGGWKKFASGLVPDDKLDLALRLIAENDGHILKGVVASGHSGYGVPDNPQAQTSQELHYLMQLDRGRFSFMHRDGQVPTGNYQVMPFDHQNFEDAYLGQLARRRYEPSSQLIAKDLLQGYKAADTMDLKDVGLQVPMTQDQRIQAAFDHAVERERRRIDGLNPDTNRAFMAGEDPYANERMTVSRYLAQDPHGFANDRVDDILNLTVGRDSTVHEHLLKKLANGEEIRRRDVGPKMIPVESLPRKVAGQTMEPWVGPGLWQTALQGSYKVLVDPVINNFSRQPLYLNMVEKHYKALQGAVDHGLIDDRDALRFAQYRAMNDVLPMIHNTALRTQFGLMVRNFMPFYFAQEQAMKRAAKAIQDSPSAVARWQLTSHAMSNPGFVHTDTTTGQSYLVYPGIGALGKYATDGMAHLGIPIIGGLPLTATGDTQSLQTVLPELRVPSVSPVVSLPLNWLTSADPLLSPLTKGVLGDRGFKQNILTSLVPNAPLRNAIMAATGDTNYSSFSNAYLSAIASAYYHGQLPTAADYESNPMKAQALMDKVRNNARTLFAMKSLLSIFTPLSPNVQSDLGMSEEWYKLLKQNNNVPGAALDAYLREHGDKAIGFTVTHSVNKAGAYLPYTNEVQSYLLDNADLIKKYPLAMAYLAPQSGTTGDVQVIHSELMRMAVKEQRTAYGNNDSFLEAIYQAQGERVYRQSQNAYYQAKGQAPNPILSQAWNDWQQQFRIWNPVAYNYIKAPDRATRAQAIYNQLQTVYANGAAPNTPQAVAVGELMNDFQQHWQQMAALVSARAQSATSQLSEQYHQHLVALANEFPQLDSVIYNVFMHLDGVLTGNA